jgi:hypothetical protein
VFTWGGGINKNRELEFVRIIPQFYFSSASSFSSPPPPPSDMEINRELERCVYMNIKQNENRRILILLQNMLRINSLPSKKYRRLSYISFIYI